MADDILNELKKYCEAANLQVSTVCVRALGSSRFPERHARRLEKIKKDEQYLREYMRLNPPTQGQSA